VKRFFDILFSFIGLIVLSPFLLIIALLVLFSGPGGVFFMQNRVGRDNEDFKLFKFRTMRPGSEKKGQLTVGSRDARVTRTGYFLRKYKLDELPQLINVLIGDMSLVGPRPEVRKYVNLYNREQMQVLSVRPGITDEASIRYFEESDLLAKAEDPERMYIEKVMPEKLRINLEYIKHRSLGRDFGIIFRTFARIVKK
jgi:lipopolysaccharide/colanic/teichoic acid biosynthesis glycosyltransferase